MKMKIKVILSFMIIAILPGMSFYLNQALVPQQSTDLALQQMNEDGSREQLRAIERMSNWIDIGLLAGGILAAAIIWSVKDEERQPSR
jgi:hypothetical protein